MLRDSVALSKSAGYGQRPKGRLFKWQGIMALHVRRDASPVVWGREDWGFTGNRR